MIGYRNLITLIGVVLMLSGCALTPETAKTTSTGQLCRLYASPGENFMSAAIHNELYARQAYYCLTPQFIQQQQAAARAQGAMMFGYGMQMMQSYQPQPQPMNQCVTRNVGGNLVTQCY